MVIRLNFTGDNMKRPEMVTRETLNEYARKIVTGIFDKEYTYNNSQTLNVIIKLFKKLNIRMEK